MPVDTSIFSYIDSFPFHMHRSPPPCGYGVNEKTSENKSQKFKCRREQCSVTSLTRKKTLFLLVIRKTVQIFSSHCLTHRFSHTSILSHFIFTGPRPPVGYGVNEKTSEDEVRISKISSHLLSHRFSHTLILLISYAPVPAPLWGTG